MSRAQRRYLSMNIVPPMSDARKRFIETTTVNDDYGTSSADRWLAWRKTEKVKKHEL